MKILSGEVIIRKANLGDLPVLLQFEQMIIETERPIDKTLKPGEIHYYDLAALSQSPESTVLVAEFESQIVATGYAKIKYSENYYQHERYAYLGFICVHPEFRGQGLNKLIIEHLIKWSHSLDIFEIRLEVYDQNVNAIKAYEKSGFKKNMVEMRLDI
ncbi:MAG: GNAT family N-acetyltransferase [Saprospiraceae bacterium]